MKKIILILIIGAISILTVSAQEQDKIKKRITYSFGADIGIPAGYVSNYSSLVAGASLQAEYPAFKNLGITASAGYLDFIAKRGGKGVPFIPLLLGLKYNFTPKIYVSGQAGMSFYAGRDNGDGSGGGSGEKYFTYVPGLGFHTSKHFDVLFKYESVYIASSSRTYSSAGVRISYNFNLN
ncbi:hypothetical protein HDE69_001688 [Pedobacter cryoconitis]|uniref:Outer membrane protein beta-barrel domain-containing protein n=1 Tax=Pedobacter cryoconitis TaxID=188932 RepID=A0A7W8YRT5_9SPHI|nr:outer membrane beta-barrel protein [Pedobacter cryoconitis]MBB5620639.1 hypothetical protein [Pedobacter cryoconitis]